MEFRRQSLSTSSMESSDFGWRRSTWARPVFSKTLTLFCGRLLVVGAPAGAVVDWFAKPPLAPWHNLQ